VGVVVRDARGHTVGGLTRDNFEVEDSGKKRDITAFSAESRTVPGAPAAPAEHKPAEGATPAGRGPAAPKRPPRFLGLVFDDLNMTVADLPRVRAAAKRFLEKGLQADDRVGIFFTTRGLTLPFTGDSARLNDAIDHLNFQKRDPALPTCPNLTAYEAYTIAEHQDSNLLAIKVEEAQNCGLCTPPPRGRNPRPDTRCAAQVQGIAQAVWEEVRYNSDLTLRVVSSMVDYMAKMPGRRALVYASSGFLSRTLEWQLQDIIDRALHADVVFNALDAKGLYTQDLGVTAQSPSTVRSIQYRMTLGTLPEWTSNDTMAVLSTATGGLFFHNNNDLDLGFRELGLVPEFSYVLGIAPAGAPDDRYHTLKVRLKSPAHGQVQSRPGYYFAAEPARPLVPERRIDKELLSDTALDGLAGSVTAAPVITPAGETGLHVVLHLDVPRLPFVDAFGVHMLKLTFIAALFDQNNAFFVGQETRAEFALKQESYDLLANGMNAGLDVLAPPGKYRLRAVIEDEAGGKLTSSSQFVEIPPLPAK
jgi:VWFA-related protein